MLSRPALLACALLAMAPTATALLYNIDCPPHEEHCALVLILEGEIRARAEASQDPLGVEAGGSADLVVELEALGAGAGANTSAEFAVSVSPTAGADVNEPFLRNATLEVGGPAVEMRFPIDFAPGLSAGQVLFVPLQVTDGTASASTHVPFTIVKSASLAAAIAEVALQPYVVAPVAGGLGALAVWLRTRRVEEG